MVEKAPPFTRALLVQKVKEREKSKKCPPGARRK
jgi:hypothetical protein